MKCSKCGHENRIGAKFCEECAAPWPAHGPAAPFTSPESYTPKHLAEKILSLRNQSPENFVFPLESRE
jgi:zinc-ribbon domain